MSPIYSSTNTALGPTREEQKRQKIADDLISRANKILCKNGKMTVTFTDNDGHVQLNPIVVGCKGERRNGSAFCQECSDKNKKV